MAEAKEHSAAVVSITPYQLSTLVMGATRYALGRTSYYPAGVCELLEAKADVISEQTRQVLVREIRAAEAEGRLGAQVDAIEWRRAMRALMAASRRAA
jgi:hypothetical protein